MKSMTVVHPNLRRPVDPEPAPRHPPLAGWAETGIVPVGRQAWGECLLCPSRFEAVEALLAHLEEVHFLPRVKVVEPRPRGRKPKKRAAHGAAPAAITCEHCYGRFVSEHALTKHYAACDRGRRYYAVAEARASGLSIRETAKALGISPQIVQRVLKRRG